MERDCQHCGTKTSNPKFCGCSCAAKTNNASRAKKLICVGCGAPRSWKDPYCSDKCKKISRLKERVKRHFIKNGRRNAGSTLRPIIMGLGLLPNECASCGLGTSYNGKPLVLHLDHINGVATDHRIENLRFLCPNCHSQTETFGRKNAIRYKKDVPISDE